MVGENFSGMADWYKKQKFTTDKSKVQRLDTDIANMTAESLNFWLIKFVLLILCKSKFIVCEISWDNIKYTPTICFVSCVLIVN